MRLPQKPLTRAGLVPLVAGVVLSAAGQIWLHLQQVDGANIGAVGLFLIGVMAGVLGLFLLIVSTSL